MENTIYLFYKTSYVNLEVNGTELSLQLVFPASTQWKEFFSGGKIKTLIYIFYDVLLPAMTADTVVWMREHRRNIFLP
jgi:hypothetical protein